jgi:hypothetical protein
MLRAGVCCLLVVRVVRGICRKISSSIPVNLCCCCPGGGILFIAVSGSPDDGH